MAIAPYLPQGNVKENSSFHFGRILPKRFTSLSRNAQQESIEEFQIFHIINWCSICALCFEIFQFEIFMFFFFPMPIIVVKFLDLLGFVILNYKKLKEKQPKIDNTSRYLLLYVSLPGSFLVIFFFVNFV